MEELDYHCSICDIVIIYIILYDLYYFCATVPAGDALPET